MGEVLRIEKDENGADFESFWLLYPRHEAKKDALKAWDKIDATLYPQILTAMYHWRRIWADREQRYLPLPATWLRGERWDDEIPSDARPMHASHVPITPGNGSRSEMPQYVRDLLTKLRK